jgi:hypothetical protein
MVRTRSLLPGAVVGVAVAAGTFVGLVDAPALAVTSGLFWAVGVSLTIRHYGVVGRAEEWRRARWSGAFGGLSTLAAFGALWTPVSADLGFALGVFVPGVALTTMHLGLGLGLEYATETGDDGTATTAGPGDGDSASSSGPA